jgi:FtsP/CotA-like multicopper oxidase with cupredoxin domain
MAERGRRWSRRDVLKLGAAAAGAALEGALVGRARADDWTPTSPAFRPFQVPMPLPGDLAPAPPEQQPGPGGAKLYVVRMRKAWQEIIPGVPTQIWGYDGKFPGPTIRGTANEPIVVRFHNDLEDVEASVHFHSGHTFADSDGHPELIVHPGESRDYHYPLNDPGGDPNDRTTTGWYHDHALDVTGPNVVQGLAGFFLVTDDVEQRLVHDRKIPAGPHGEYDIPIIIQDRRFHRTGEIFYDPFDHDGYLGDVYVVNGKAQPYLEVQRRKYRLRLLNGCNARFLELRLSWGRFLRFGYDGFLLPHAVAQDTIFTSSATRADVVVDFRNAPDVVYLENLCDQEDGRGPGGDSSRPDRLSRGVPLLKFVVTGPTQPDDASLQPGDPVRPNTPIEPGEIVATRRFVFDRRQGAWQINDRFFDPRRDDARPRLGTAERWILENKSGGWWHPVHMHLEAHQVVRFNGRRVRTPFKQDTTILGPNDVAEVYMRFRDYPGRFVFHCHNVEHEDVRMMGQFKVVEP